MNSYVCLLLIFVVSIHAERSNLDRSYGQDTTGIIINSPAEENVGNALGLQTISGEDYAVVAVQTDSDARVIRYDPLGAVDTTFAGGGFVLSAGGFTFSPTSIVLNTALGEFIVAGTRTDSTGISNFFWLRLDSTTGAQVGSTVFELIGDSSAAYGVGIDGSNNVILGGVSVTAGVTSLAIARYTSAGALLGTTTTAVGDSAIGRSVAIDGSDNIYLGGSAIISGVTQTIVARYTSGGVLDVTYNGGGSIPGVADNIVGSVSQLNAILFDGTNIVGVGESDSELLALRLVPAGTLDGTFGTGGVVTDGFAVRSLAFGVALSGTDLMVGGRADTDALVVKYDSTGAIDTTFGDDGSGSIVTAIGEDAQNSGVAVQSTDSKIVTVGLTDSSISVVRYLPDNTTNTVNILVPADTPPSLTTATTPISGVASESNASISITVGGLPLITTTTDANGAWDAGTSPILNTQAPGTTIAATLAIGGSDSKTVTTTAADSIVITFPVANQGIVQSTIVTGQSSRVGANVDVDVDGNTPIIAVTAADGTWTTFPTETNPVGDSTLSPLSQSTITADLGPGLATDTVDVFVVGESISTDNYAYAYRDTGNQNLTTTFAAVGLTDADTITGWTTAFPSLTCNQTGIYLVEYRAMVARQNTTGGTTPFAIFRGTVAGVEVPGSVMAVQMPAITNFVQEISGTFLMSIDSGQAFQMQAREENGNVQIRPEQANNKSVTLSIRRVA